jgi:hypothetical protein
MFLRSLSRSLSFIYININACYLPLRIYIPLPFIINRLFKGEGGGDRYGRGDAGRKPGGQPKGEPRAKRGE